MLVGDPARGRLPQALVVVGPDALEPLAPAVVAEVGADAGALGEVPHIAVVPSSKVTRPSMPRLVVRGSGANTPHCCSDATIRTAVSARSPTERCTADSDGRWVATWASSRSTIAAEMTTRPTEDRSTRSDKRGDVVDASSSPIPIPKPYARRIVVTVRVSRWLGAL